MKTPSEDPEVLDVVGIPHGAIGEDGRTRLRFDRQVMASFPPHVVVLSRLPLIDEVDRRVMSNPRVRVHDQSDSGVYVRMALLKHVFLSREPTLSRSAS